MASTSAGRKTDLVVIGGGPAGMAAAVFAAREGLSVTLLEKNEKLGKKLYITGKGRCNLTNVAEIEDFFAQVPHNPRFLQSAVRGFPASALMDWIEGLGVPLTVQRGGRVFPRSEKASDITRALARALHEAGVQVRFGAVAQALRTEQGILSGVRLIGGEELEAGACVLATGGMSYPATGSTGDGYALSAALGHTVRPPRPALVPFETEEQWPRTLSGLSLKNVALRVWQGGKKRYDRQGELLFTHFGISGPLAIELSSLVAEAPLSELRVALDMKPALSPETLDARLVRELAAHPKKAVSGVLAGLLPSRMAALAPGLLGIDPALPCGQVPKAGRRALGAWLKGIPLTLTGTRGLSEAVITRGGVEVREINPSTLMSKKIPGLFFAGELIDVDALTGGYNLQIAFSTGVLAGRSAAAYTNETF